MNKVISNFERILERQATESERENLRRVKDVMGLEDNDAIWTVMIGLQHYQSLYENIPERIKLTSIQTLDDFRDTAEKIADAAIAKSKSELSQTVADTAKEIARINNQKDRLKWICTAIAVSCCLVIGIYMIGKNYGYKDGYDEATLTAKTAEYAQNWSQTPQGKMAYQMALKGSLDHVLNCDQPGWKKDNGVCLPYPQKNRIYGWRLP